ncbi:MAG: acetate non-utilizing protein 9 [Phylliscum demangeonii]|nr:MAG: acetate non-utilizing protein 9 [Phylliscum demangeonii]
MKTLSRLLMATPMMSASRTGLGMGPLALLPPIPLYRRLLRAHRRKLPRPQRLLGDEYVKAEFRRHRDVENPIHIIGFLTEWQLYAQAIEGDAWQGGIDQDTIHKMSAQLMSGYEADEQLRQLYDLMQTVKNRDETD